MKLSLKHTTRIPPRSYSDVNKTCSFNKLALQCVVQNSWTETACAQMTSITESETWSRSLSEKMLNKWCVETVSDWTQHVGPRASKFSSFHLEKPLRISHTDALICKWDETLSVFHPRQTVGCAHKSHYKTSAMLMLKLYAMIDAGIKQISRAG